MNIVQDIATPILKLALPLILIQLCQASLALINTMIAGRYHYVDLAAIGLGSNIWSPVFILFVGILYVLVPKFAALKHRSDTQQSLILFHQAKHVAMTLAILGFIIIQILAFLSPYFIQDTQVAVISKQYLHYVAFAMPALVYMVLYRFISEGNSYLKPIMISYLIMLVCDSLLCFVFVNGMGFIPEMGGAGTGLATIMSAYIALFILRYLVANAVPIIKIIQDNQQVKYQQSLQLLKQGLPIGITLVLQILALATLAFFAATLGTEVIAAHQIVINIAMVIIMIPIAISSATTIQISAFDAIHHQKGKVWTMISAAIFTLLYAALMATLLIFFAQQLTSMFSQEPIVLEIAAGLIYYAAIFLVFDAMQTVASGVLRGLQQFIQPLIVILFCYWMIIIPLSYLLGVKGWWQAHANVDIIWIILALGMCLAAALLILQSYRLISNQAQTDDQLQSTTD